MQNGSGPRHIPNMPYDPLRAACAIEKSVTKGNARLYSCFSVSPNFGGSVKAYAVGCELRCGFCWSPVRATAEIAKLQAQRQSLSDTLRKQLTPVAAFHKKTLNDMLNIDGALSNISSAYLSPAEVVTEMVRVYNTRRLQGIGEFEILTEGEVPSSVRYFTISGGEPTLCRSHLVEVLESFCAQDLPVKFLLQTHGFLLGSDPSYLKELRKFHHKLEVRVSFKAGTPLGLQNRTGVAASAFDFPFRAVESLLDLGMRFHLAAMSDPAIMPGEERWSLIQKLSGICSNAGMPLVSLNDMSSTQEENGELKEGLQDAIFLDEERYVPIFPEILSLHSI